MSELRADVTIGRQTVKGAHTWLASDGVSTIADAQSTLGQIALTPHNVTAIVTLSRQLVKQSEPAARQFVDHTLAATLAEAVDGAMLAGSGANGQPTGLANVAGIDTRAGTSFAWADDTEMLAVCEGFSGDSIA